MEFPFETYFIHTIHKIKQTVDSYEPLNSN